MKAVKNIAGFYEILPKPSPSVLELFYSRVPLGSSTGYTHEIDEEEQYHRAIGCLEADFFCRNTSLICLILDVEKVSF